MFKAVLEVNDADSDDNTLIGGGDEDKVYTMCKWYAYDAKVMLQNIDSIQNQFPGREYLSAEDIVEHVVYGKNGCYVLLDNLRGLKKRLRELEIRIKNGKWNSRYTAGLSKLNSENIDMYIDDISNTHKLETMNHLIHEDLYMTYFVKVYPNVNLPEPKIPHFSHLPRESVSIKNTKKVEKLIKDSIPYLTMLEQFHGAMAKLLIQLNKGLDKLISM